MLYQNSLGFFVGDGAKDDKIKANLGNPPLEPLPEE